MHASLGCSVEVDSLEYGYVSVFFEKELVYHEGFGNMSIDKRIMYTSSQGKVNRYMAMYVWGKVVQLVFVNN